MQFNGRLKRTPPVCPNRACWLLTSLCHLVRTYVIRQRLIRRTCWRIATPFYKQINANVVHQFLVNSLTATGYSNVLQGEEDEISFTCPVIGSIVVDRPCLLHLIWQKVDPSLTVNAETLRAKIKPSSFTVMKIMLTRCSPILRRRTNVFVTWTPRVSDFALHHYGCPFWPLQRFQQLCQEHQR